VHENDLEIGSEIRCGGLYGGGWVVLQQRTKLAHANTLHIWLGT
jgi:hypothetical protein